MHGGHFQFFRIVNRRNLALDSPQMGFNRYFKPTLDWRKDGKKNQGDIV